MSFIDMIERNVQWHRPALESSMEHTKYPRYNLAYYENPSIQVLEGDEQPLNNMTPQLTEWVLSQFTKEIEVPDNWSYVGVNRYDQGDYIPPHYDPWPWHALMVFTSSEHDGIVIEDKEEKRFNFYNDTPGRVLHIEQCATHWVNPVRDAPRYSAVVGILPQDR